MRIYVNSIVLAACKCDGEWAEEEVTKSLHSACAIRSAVLTFSLQGGRR